ncbi:MAG TPA: hypothetical protein VJT31_12010, partial [Rugosimonospora sp.]|nr:hypothetical protein [Rugosimonospora sp.]
MGLRRRAGLGMFALGIGYFLSFTPYSALAKAMSSGLLPGMHRPVTGPELLPSSALGLLAGMVIFLLISGWWRQARTRQLGRWRIPFPGRETARSAFFMSLIVGTTTLNFSFVGVSILFVLVLERLETIVLAPSIDLIRRRRIRTYSWIALGLCALAAAVTLADVHNYRLTLFAALSIITYLAGYTGRFDVMSRHAKTGTPADRRYFVEEHMTTPLMLLLVLGVFALIGQGTAMQSLRYGFTTFLTTPIALYGMLIGLCYEALFIFTTHIFLDRREFAFGMPVHVCASLLAGIASSLILQAVYHTAPPSTAQFAAAGCVAAAAVVLSYPTLVAVLRPRLRPAAGRMLLFVCGGNTCRSAMAEAIAHAELATHGLDSWQVASAGLTATPGTPLTAEAATALRDLGVPTRPHRSRRLTPRMLSRA